MNIILMKKLYHRFASLKSKCYNPTAAGYNKYGKKGITICKEWLESLDNFIVWAIKNGFDDPNKKIFRIDRKGNFEPKNCIIMTTKEFEKYKKTFEETEQKSLEKSNDDNAIFCANESVIINYNNKKIRFHIMNNKLFINRQELGKFIYCTNVIKFSSRVRYYEAKTLEENKNVNLIKAYTDDAINNIKCMYDLKFLELMKKHFIFKDKVQESRYNQLLNIMKNPNKYITTNKCLIDCDDLNGKYDSNDKIKLIDKLTSLCTESQGNKFLQPLKKIIELEDKKATIETEIKKIEKCK